MALEAKDRATAFRAFRSVVKLDRDHAPAWAHLARMHMSEGQVIKADAALRETQRIKPTDPIVLDLIGMTLSQMGEHDVAKAFFPDGREPKFVNAVLDHMAREAQPQAF